MNTTQYGKAIIKLDKDLYEIKTRVDALTTLTEIVAEEQPEEESDLFGTLVYNAISRIEVLPYLVSSNEFPAFHYDLSHIRNITTDLLKEKLLEIKNLLTTLHGQVLHLSEEDKAFVSFASGHLLPGNWHDWTDILETAIEEIHGAMMFYSED